MRAHNVELGNRQPSLPELFPRGTNALFQARISIDYARRVVRLTVVPLSHGGEYQLQVRDELQSSRFTTRIAGQVKILPHPGWTMVSGERKGNYRAAGSRQRNLNLNVRLLRHALRQDSGSSSP